MILVTLIIILLFGGILAGLVERRWPGSARWISLASVLVVMVLILKIWGSYSIGNTSNAADTVFLVFQKSWIPEFGIEFHLELDGLGLVLIMLTGFLGLISVLISWVQIRTRTGFYYFNLLWTLAGIMGVFLAFDLFLFYLFWEVMLVPMYFLISIWGSANRTYAAYKFFIYTQVGGLLMLLALLTLYYIHGTQTGNYTFDYWMLMDTSLDPGPAKWIMLGFLLAFLIKLPVIPLHNWLPDAHSEAPTAGSVILAGLLLKTGAYGIIRFVIPFFPEAARSIAMPAMILGVAGILYGAKLAFAQTDIKRLVAYTSVSHMGFVMIGVFAFNTLAMQGVIMQLIAHGLSTGALFVLAGIFYERTGTRDIEKVGGLWSTAPKMGAAALILVLASLGLPGLANFVAEFMTLAGTFAASRIIAVLAALGLIAAAIYSLRIMQKVFFGPSGSSGIKDLSTIEAAIIASVVILLIFLGLYPRPVTQKVEPIVEKVVTISLEKEPDSMGQLSAEKIKPANGKY